MVQGSNLGHSDLCIRSHKVPGLLCFAWTNHTGEIMFTRVSKAKDEISDFFKRGSGPPAYCQEHENCERMQAKLERGR
eukprot:SAG22_NODE_13_length_33548_cov_57.167773_25_plen_78_part_00